MCCRKMIAPPEDAAKPSLYPRIDPAVIMAIAHGGHLLLGRQARWVPGRYSLLAGERQPPTFQHNTEHTDPGIMAMAHGGHLLLGAGGLGARYSLLAGDQEEVVF